ncbi:MAG: hypothetical protein NTV07_04105 [Candidatus Omnitrophica bacterium]|nr:hypothetical protein [Candidatus Omnitrophota bacterium]
MLSEIKSGLKKDQFDNNIYSIYKKTRFPETFHGIVLTIYQPQTRRIRNIATGSNCEKDLLRALQGVLKNNRYKEFNFSDSSTRLQMDFILQKPEKIDLSRMSQNAIGTERFEIGVDGLLVIYGNKKLYFLPGDAFTQSILSLDHLKSYIKKRFRDIPFDKLTFYRFHTDSYISYQNVWLKLYRGYPIVGKLTKTKLEKTVGSAIDFVIRNQKPNGQFLYYYEASRDSYVDHEHPKHDPQKNPYYNELRHCGGALLLLYDYRLYKDEKLLQPTRLAIEFIIPHIVVYKLADGSEAGYLYYNRKAKLGGSGIALYLLSEYQHLTGDPRYEKYAVLLARHLLSQITPTGEFTYYYIYLDKIIDWPEENIRLFNFYYPGEAIVGLATYHKYLVKDEADGKFIRKKLKLALDFLLRRRPEIYHKAYANLPSDSWLMMGINELWDIPEMRQKEYKDFVYEDADKMTAYMYTKKDALYQDYIGAFYYDYGDPPYADGARAEGLTAALELAHKTGDEKRVRKYYDALKLAAWATLHLCNTPESVYSVPRPDKTISGIRFKYTRQWFRIDTIHHVAAFYLKFMPYWRD